MKTMPKNKQEERYRWIKPILGGDISIKQMVKVCPFSERTLKYWLERYRDRGFDGLRDMSTRPKTHPKETAIHLKRKVIELRKKEGLCALKLHWRLGKKGVHIHERTIGKILKSEGLTRKYRVKRVKYKYLRAERKPGELLEMDVKHVPGPIAGRKYYQYTAIDTSSRWRHLEVFDEEITCHSIEFLKIVMKRFPYTIQAIKTDNHSTFTNYYLGTNKRSDMRVKTLHAFDVFCAKQGIVHYLIDKGKPAQNGTVERSHREDQEKFYDKNIFKDFTDLKRKIKIWNMYYNNLEHCGLDGKTPNESLRLS